MNESCHTYEWVMSHIWMSHVTHMNESCHTYEWVMSPIMRHVTQQIDNSLNKCMHPFKHAQFNESCHTLMSHVTHWWVMSHIDGSIHTLMRQFTRWLVMSHVWWVMSRSKLTNVYGCIQICIDAGRQSANAQLSGVCVCVCVCVVMSHIDESCHTLCDMSHIDESCHTLMSYVTQLSGVTWLIKRVCMNTCDMTHQTCACMNTCDMTHQTCACMNTCLPRELSICSVTWRINVCHDSSMRDMTH